MVCVCVCLFNVRAEHADPVACPESPQGAKDAGGVGRPGVFLAITRYIRFLKTKTLTGNKEETIVGFT